ncbi:hypothetical protein PL11201_170040 [Planktothrix sp. PCC 11201]|nr:hypothetical protein PL11201_170040 [Planktothrix sp. PCC 11201]
MTYNLSLVFTTEVTDYSIWCCQKTKYDYGFLIMLILGQSKFTYLIGIFVCRVVVGKLNLF